MILWSVFSAARSLLSHYLFPKAEKGINRVAINYFFTFMLQKLCQTPTRVNNYPWQCPSVVKVALSGIVRFINMAL